MAGVDDRLRRGRSRMRLVLGDMLAARTVTPFARHAKEEAVRLVSVDAAWHVGEPGVVTFLTAERPFAAQVAGRAQVEGNVAPLAERVQPGDGQFGEAISVPGEIDLVETPRTKHVANRRDGPVLPIRSVAD